MYDFNEKYSTTHAIDNVFYLSTTFSSRLHSVADDTFSPSVVQMAKDDGTHWVFRYVFRIL